MRTFRRFQRKEGIDDDALREAIRAGAGFDADGGGLSSSAWRERAGPFGGYRTIIAYRAGTRAVFLYGFAKNEKDNIEEDELKALQQIGGNLLKADDRRDREDDRRRPTDGAEL